jgi:hypothetical protein
MDDIDPRTFSFIMRPSRQGGATLDLGIAGRKAIVCASSRGLGRACAEALAKEGVEVIINGRDAARLAMPPASSRRSRIYDLPAPTLSRFKAISLPRRAGAPCLTRALSRTSW